MTTGSRGTISIHALLAESDPGPKVMTPERYYFYPRSPCGERRHPKTSDHPHNTISIHALLAESDSRAKTILAEIGNFYPRSPCGERRQNYECFEWIKEFLSTLSLRRATRRGRPVYSAINTFLSTLSLRRATSGSAINGSQYKHFYPRSPCGERRNTG